MLSQQMTDTEFFKIMAGVYNINLAEADEWSFISAAREDRALVFNDRSQLDTLKADLAAAQAQVAALKAENARLMEIVSSIEARIDTDLKENWRTNLNAAVKQLLEDEIAIKQLCMNARQPAAQEAQS